jgi:hypothetical protein
MRFFLLALLLLGCAKQPQPMSTAAPTTPAASPQSSLPPAQALSAPTAPAAPAAPASAPTGGAITGVPSRRRTTQVQLNSPASASQAPRGELLDDSQVPPALKGRKVYRVVEGDREILKSEDGLVLSVQPVQR